ELGTATDSECIRHAASAVAGVRGRGPRRHRRDAGRHPHRRRQRDGGPRRIAWGPDQRRARRLGGAVQDIGERIAPDPRADAARRHVRHRRAAPRPQRLWDGGGDALHAGGVRARPAPDAVRQASWASRRDLPHHGDGQCDRDAVDGVPRPPVGARAAGAPDMRAPRAAGRGRCGQRRGERAELRHAADAGGDRRRAGADRGSRQPDAAGPQERRADPAQGPSPDDPRRRRAAPRRGVRRGLPPPAEHAGGAGEERPDGDGGGTGLRV
ncbi:MAG: cAMP-binding proteins - catabolite gene activator and regulatory subunit of cAMP-dependent protein kinases, partial [uncultured Sphingomonadaceae bacterium]